MAVGVTDEDRLEVLLTVGAIVYEAQRTDPWVAQAAIANELLALPANAHLTRRRVGMILAELEERSYVERNPHVKRPQWRLAGRGAWVNQYVRFPAPEEEAAA